MSFEKNGVFVCSILSCIWTSLGHTAVTTAAMGGLCVVEQSPSLIVLAISLFAQRCNTSMNTVQ